MEEEVLLCWAAAAGHNFFFFGAVGEGNIEVEVSEAGTGLLILGVMLSGGTFLLRYMLHTLPITCGRQAAVEGKEGSGRLRGRWSSHRPRDGIILGLLCQARTD